MTALLLAKRLYGLAHHNPYFYSFWNCRIRPLVKPKNPQQGQGMVEYALILVLVVIVVIVVLALVGPLINRIYGTIACALHKPINMMDCFETPTPEPTEPTEPPL